MKVVKIFYALFGLKNLIKNPVEKNQLSSSENEISSSCNMKADRDL
jgi:hypothetical protein